MAYKSRSAALQALAAEIGATPSVEELPEVTASDNGKALLVSGGKWQKCAIPSQLPDVTASDEGKVLTVNSSGAWAAAALPSG